MYIRTLRGKQNKDSRRIRPQWSSFVIRLSVCIIIVTTGILYNDSALIGLAVTHSFEGKDVQAIQVSIVRRLSIILSLLLPHRAHANVAND